MIRRNHGVGKVIAGVVIFFGAVYTIYLYNDLSGQLKHTERTAERYRREQESVSAQLQDLTAKKNEIQQRCENEKQEMTSRLDSLNQQHKMLKSQHDDMESEFSRLQSEHDREKDEHQRLDEERTLEYNRFKQEKILEISNLKDSVANLEREKEQFNDEITKLKSQLQNSLTQVKQDKQTIFQLEQDLQQYKDQVTRDKQSIAQLERQVQEQKPKAELDKGDPKKNEADKLHLQQNQALIEDYQGRLAHAQNLVQQANQQQQQIQQQQQQQQVQQQQPVQQQQQHQNLPGGAAFPIGAGQNVNRDNFGQAQQGGFFQAQNPKPIVNQQQGVFNQQQPVGNQGQEKIGEIEGMNVNIAEEILQSLKDKHKPIDADEVEEQQKQHQILPPLDHDKMAADLKDEKKDLHNEEGLHAGDKGHDNRLQNQGPVGLQVQEPKLKPDMDHDAERKNLLFRPKVPEAIDNQIQPNQPVDDTIKQEQMDIMPVKPMPIDDRQLDNIDQGDHGDNLEHDDDEEDNENYDDADDQGYDNKNDKEDDAY